MKFFAGKLSGILVLVLLAGRLSAATYYLQSTGNAPWPYDPYGGEMPMSVVDEARGIYLVEDVGTLGMRGMRAMSLDFPLPGEGGTNDYIEYTNTYTVDTNGLWLSVEGLGSYRLHNATNEVYAILSKTNLSEPAWKIEGDLWPTNTEAMPFTLSSTADRMFVWAQDWTGVTSGGNTVPDWWLWHWFGTTALADTNVDVYGDTLWSDYQAGYDPNIIQFTVTFTNSFLRAAPAVGEMAVQWGLPAAVALLVNETDLDTAGWEPFVPTNVTVAFTTNGVYNVWVGLKGPAAEATPAWEWTTLVYDTEPPTIIVTNGVATSRRVAWQLGGYADEALDRLTYAVSNAAGVITNLEGYGTGGIYDTNVMAFTTNYFQGDDVPLAEGLNVITLHGWDMAGNEAVTNFTVTLTAGGDTNAPVLTVIWPEAATKIVGSNLVVQAQVDDAAASVQAVINGQAAMGRVARDGSVWIEGLVLAEGTNLLVLTARNVAGHASTNLLAVVREEIGLTVNPPAGDLATISGTVGDTNDAVLVNGVAAVVNADGTWSATGVGGTAGGSLTVAVYAGTNQLGGVMLAVTPPSVVRPWFFRETYDTAGDFASSCYDYGNYAMATEVTRVWSRGYGWSRQHWVDTRLERYLDCETEVEWPAEWPDGANLEGVSGCDGEFTEGTPKAWVYCRGDCSYGASQDSASEPSLPPGCVKSQAYTTSRRVETRVEVVGGGRAGDGDRLIRLTVAANTDYPQFLYWVPYVHTAPNEGGPGAWPLPLRQVRMPGLTLKPTATNALVGECFLTLPPGARRDVTPLVAGGYYYDGNAQAQYYTFDVQAADLNLQLAVDNNRDGNVTFDTQDETSAANPYRFWVNNDRDDYNEDIEDLADLNPSSWSDASNTSIPNTRDLEDYTRLWINTQGLTEDLKAGNLLLALQWKSTTGSPALRFFPAYETDGGALYLTDETTAQAQTNAPYGNCLNGGGVDMLQGATPFFIPTTFWANLSDGQPVAYLLFDAVGRGKGQLVICIYKNDGVTKLAEVPQSLYLDLKDVKEMYERWTVGEDPAAAPATTANLASGYAYDTSIPAENNYILFVHGWNLAPWERDAFAGTAFKRLYWQGYKGRFGAFQWPTGYGISDTLSAVIHARNYDNSESNAWASATGLLGKLNDLNSAYPNHVYLMAHSMGNVVAGEALKQASSQLVNTYVAMQGAISAHGYDPNTPVWTTSGSTPDIYANYWTNGAPSYFDASAGAGTYINFYNTKDYALKLWKTDQYWKPDHGITSYPGYYYSTPSGTHPSGFYKIVGASIPDIDLFFPANNYEVLAYCVQSQSLALGATADVGGKFSDSQVDLKTVWPADMHDGNDYGAHVWHSAEFNFDNMQQKDFWKSVLSQMGFSQ